MGRIGVMVNEVRWWKTQLASPILDAKFHSCIFVVAATWIAFRNRGSYQWMLGITSIVLFVFVTIHAAASLRQLLEAFIYIPASPPGDNSYLYWDDAAAPVAV